MNSEKNIIFRSFAMIMQFGLNMLVPILACSYGGYRLGEKWGMPVLTIAGFFIGAVAGGTAVYRQARSIYKKNSRDAVSDVSSAGISEFYRQKKEPHDPG